MAKVTVYTTEYCPYCRRAKSLLEARGISYEEINLQDKPYELKALKEKTGWRTVPQIFIDDQLVGGFMELQALDRDGKLGPLTKT